MQETLHYSPSEEEENGLTSKADQRAEELGKMTNQYLAGLKEEGQGEQKPDAARKERFRMLVEEAEKAPAQFNDKRGVIPPPKLEASGYIKELKEMAERYGSEIFAGDEILKKRYEKLATG